MANRYIKILRSNRISAKGGTILSPASVRFDQADSDKATYDVDYTRWLEGSTISGTPSVTQSGCTVTSSNTTTVITLTVSAVSGNGSIEIQTTAADGRIHTLSIQIVERFASPYAGGAVWPGASPTNPTLPSPTVSGSMLRATGTAYELRTPAEVLADIGAESWENVRSVKEADFGAVGDGTTDDTTALQAAINWAGEAAGRALFFPDGIYLVSNTLTAAPAAATSNITLFSMNSEKVTIKRTFTNGHTLVLGVTDALSRSSGSVRITGLSFQHGTSYTSGDASLDNRVTTEYAHLVLFGGQEPLIEDCRFYRMPVGILMSGVTLPHIKNCRFSQTWDHTVTNLQEGIAALKFEKSATHGSCKDAEISHNFFAGANSSSRSVTYGAASVSIAENVGGKYAILVEDLETATITGNYFGGLNEAGIKFDIQASQAALNLTISGNFFDACRLYAIDVAAANGTYLFNTTISANSFNAQNNGNGAIRIVDNGSGTESASAIVISDNSMVNGVKTPVSIDGAVNVNFSGNIITAYNYHNGGSTNEWAAGALFGANSSLVTCVGNSYGGGGNLADSASGPNYTKWGVVFAAASVGSAFAEKSLGFGLGSGGLVSGNNPTIEHSLSVTGTIPGFGTGGNQFFADQIGSTARFGAINGGGSAITGLETYVNNAKTYTFDPSGPVFQLESGAAATDTAGFGQWWVKNDTPNVPMFTDDAGTDFKVVTVGTSKSLGCELVETQTLSGASELVIDDLSSEYRMYEIVITDFKSSTDATNFRLRTSTDNGSSWDSGATDYVTKLRYSWGGAAFTMFYSQDGLPALGLGLGNDTNESSTIVLRVFNPSAASFTRIESTLYGRDASGTYGEFAGFVTRQSAADVDAIRIFADAGTLTGSVAVYGYRAA